MKSSLDPWGVPQGFHFLKVFVVFEILQDFKIKLKTLQNCEKMKILPGPQGSAPRISCNKVVKVVRVKDIKIQLFSKKMK